MKYLLYFLVPILLNNSAKSQDIEDTYLQKIESCIGMSQAALKLFINKAFKASVPGKVTDQGKTYFTLDNNDIHAEYFINHDSCFYATIRFKNDNDFNKASEFLKANATTFRDFDNYFKRMTKTYKLLYYEVNVTDKLIIASDSDYYLKVK